LLIFYPIRKLPCNKAFYYIFYYIS